MSSYTTQFEYLDHLKRALAGLPEQLVANTLADYQQRYIDGLSAGRSEAEIADEMDDPRVVAARVAKAAVPAAGVLETPPAASGVARVFFAGLGLAVFNFFMFLPAMVYLVLLIALPVVSGVTYTVGIAVTASSLAGVNELVLDGPFRHVVMHKKAGADQADAGDNQHGRLHINIGPSGINIRPEPSSMDGEIDSGTVVIGNSDIGEPNERTAGTLKGIALILGGILLALMSMVVFRYTWIGLKAYVKMNIRLLRGN